MPTCDHETHQTVLEWRSRALFRIFRQLRMTETSVTKRMCDYFLAWKKVPGLRTLNESTLDRQANISMICYQENLKYRT